ncbi:MAG: type II secretion system protein M [Magnetococcales bacterium]|nr:type II secretion system protein M [Magnetococcales bacterium]
MNMRRYDRLSRRERLLLLLTILAALLSVWYRLVWMPLFQAKQQVETRLAEQEQREDTAGDDRAPPWEVQASRWLPAGEIPAVLDRLTQPREGLQMVGLELRPPRLLFSCDQESEKGGPVTLFRHELILTWEGGYPAILTYLHGLERLPWKIHVDHLDYSIRHPSLATLLLQLHFFSSAPSLFVD